MVMDDRPDLLGLADDVTSDAAFEAIGVDPPVRCGGFAAVFAPDPRCIDRLRSILLIRLMDNIPTFLPFPANTISRESLPMQLLRNEQRIKYEIGRLAGRREMVVSIAFPAPAANHLPEGAGIRWLKRRSDHLKALSFIRKRATEHLQALSDALDGAAEAQCLSPFGSSRKVRIGADLAFLIPARLAPALREELSQAVPRMLPRGEDVTYDIQGPLPPHSFAPSFLAEADQDVFRRRAC